MDKKTIILIGDSLIEWYDWAARFKEHTIHNLGISGETVEGMLGRLPRVTQSIPNAEMVFVLTGINNVAMNDLGIIKPYRLALKELAGTYPHAKLYAISLLPTLLPWINATAIETLNEDMMELARKHEAEYIDLHSTFLRHGLKELLSEDGIHISPTGYSVFSAELAPYINQDISQA